MAEKSRYIAFYKPYGVLTSFTDEQERSTLKQYINLPDVYPAGRLDMDSEGLLLLTDDGPLAHRLTDPRFNHPKTYLVQVEGLATPEQVAKLEGGVMVKGEKTRRSQVVIIAEPVLPERGKDVTPHGPTTWLRIVLREGKKRQIRHMTAAVGLPTLRIVRVAVGSISIGDLKPGEWRELTAEEVQSLKQLPAERPVLRPKAKKPVYLPTARGKPAAYPGSVRGSRGRSGGRQRPGR